MIVLPSLRGPQAWRYSTKLDGYFDEVMGLPPAPWKRDFYFWKQGLRAKRLAWCNQTRATTYYFAASGNNANDGLTPATAKQTIAEANSVINGSSGNIAVLFKRGDEFRGSTGLTVTKNKVTVGAYGTGSKPILSAFSVDLFSGGGHWTLASGTRHTKAIAGRVGWIRERTSDTARKSPYARLASSAAVEAMPGSWFWGSGVLHINARGGVDPNLIDFEYVDASGWTSAGDWVVGADGVHWNHVDQGYCVNIRADGWGCSAGQTWQNYGFRISVKDRETVVVENCDCYYSGRHGPSTNSHVPGTQGGICWFLNCKSGFLNATAASANHFNSYASAAGQETVFDGCVCEFGRAPDATIDGVTKKHDDTFSASFYGHANSGTARLILLWDCGNTRSANPGATYPHGAADFDPTYLPGDDADPSTYRYYNFGYQCTHLGDTRIGYVAKGWLANWDIDVEVFSTAATNPTNFVYGGGTAGGVCVNHIYRFRDLVSAKTRSIVSTALVCTTRFHFCEIWVEGTHASQSWWMHQGTSEKQVAMRMYNCLLHRQGTMKFTPNCNQNAAGTYLSNATRQVQQTGTSGIDSDDEQVILGLDLIYGDLPTLGSPLIDGNPTAGGFTLEYDHDWNLRDSVTPTIGAHRYAV